MRSDPPTVPAELPIDEAVAKLAASGASCLVVVDAEDVPVGIVTERDVLTRVVPLAERGAPVATVATAPLKSVHPQDNLHQAIYKMRHAKLRHIPVLENSGQLVGVMSLVDALSVAAGQTLELIDMLSADDTLKSLKQVKQAQIDIAETLFDDGVHADDIQRALSDINLDLMHRAIDVCIASMASDGLGGPPVEFCVLIMGSAGRGESFLFPDQDNGFILDDYDDDRHTEIDGWFIELAERMTDMFNEMGFVYCPGYVMATNPLWRKTRTQWVEQLKLWIRRDNLNLARLGDIFFDFRAVWGREDFAQGLRRAIAELLPKQQRFLRDMYHEDAEGGVALGWFGRFVTVRSGEYKGKMNMKHQGLLPLIAPVRLMSLKHGITSTSTRRRLDKLHAGGVLEDDEHDYLKAAYRRLTNIVLRQQIADFRAGQQISYFVDPNSLSKRERDLLVDALKAVDRLRDRMKADLTGDIF
jgi:signal-transduction protein with cAMP-binding, CBS, and nucleotidyltransferase domain